MSNPQSFQDTFDRIISKKTINIISAHVEKDGDDLTLEALKDEWNR